MSFRSTERQTPQPPWGNQGSELRAAALPGQRPQPGDGGYRAVEHGVPGTRHPGVGRGRQAGGRRAAAIPVAAGLGAHQPNRRLRLAAEPQTGRREVSALTDARKTLAYDFFRILRAPLSHLRKAEREDGRPGPRPRAPGARGRRADPRHGPRADAAAGAPEGRQRGRARP